MLGQRGGHGGAWVAGKAGGEIAGEDASEFGGAAAAGCELRYRERGGGGFGAESGVEVQALGDEVEGFAGALEREQAFDVLFGQSGDIAGVVPGGHRLANPGVGVDGVPVFCEPVLQ